MSTMAKYVKVQTEQQHHQSTPNEIRVSSASSSVGKYIGYALKLLEQEEQGTSPVIIRGSGMAIAKVCQVSEILRQRVHGLAIRTKIITETINDVYEPTEEGLDVVHMNKQLVVLEITLSKEKGWKDANRGKQGFQEELPEDQIVERPPQRNFRGDREEGGYRTRGGRRGGNRRGDGDRRRRDRGDDREFDENRGYNQKAQRGGGSTYNRDRQQQRGGRHYQDRDEHQGGGRDYRDNRDNYRQQREYQGGRDNRDKECYNCGKKGHISTNCRASKEFQKGHPADMHRERRQYNDQEPRTCHHCKKEGHIQKFCPDKQ